MLHHPYEKERERNQPNDMPSIRIRHIKGRLGILFASRMHKERKDKEENDRPFNGGGRGFKPYQPSPPDLQHPFRTPDNSTEPRITMVLYCRVHINTSTFNRRVIGGDL